jgi:hypothetical protein
MYPEGNIKNIIIRDFPMKVFKGGRENHRVLKSLVVYQNRIINLYYEAKINDK